MNFFDTFEIEYLNELLMPQKVPTDNTNAMKNGLSKQKRKMNKGLL